MTAEILRSALIKRVDEIREKSIRALRTCRFTPATGTDKGIIPATTLAEIALKSNECNAWIEACEAFTSIVHAESMKILQPESKKETGPKKKARSLYG